METRLGWSDAVNLLNAADERLAIERRRIDDEVAAFAAFGAAVRDVDPGTNSGGCPTAVAGGIGLSGRSAGLQAVASAYEETVMSVPHYDEDYGDTLQVSLQEEFGPTVAAAVVKGSSLTSRHKSVVLSAAAEARNGRESMRDLVEEERDAVASATERVQGIETDAAEVAGRAHAEASFGTLETTREQLLDLTERCEAGVDRRQETIARLRRRTLEPVDTTDYREFCYASLDVDHPVLAAYADLIERIERVQGDVERQMAYADE